MIIAIKKRTMSLRAIGALIGPAFVAAVAYVDPGNFATNLSAGAHYGYLLLWVLVLTNLMASVLQYLSAKVGLVTGQSLPEVIRDYLPRRIRIAYWAQAELVSFATDLAEVLGGAIALQLLFGLPLFIGGFITGIVSMLLLTIQNRQGQKTFEQIIIGLVLIIPVGFIAGLLLHPPNAVDAARGLIPRFAGTNSVLLATGMLGATVMPHVIYLHSALARDRHGHVDKKRLNYLLKATRCDVGIAMIVAGGVNIAMLLLAATLLRSVPNIQTIFDVHSALSHLAGPMIAILFALGLLIAGLASTSVGCYAGAVVMDGLLRRRVPLLLRRSITLIPALYLIGIGLEPTRALVLSQVALSFGIPFAVIPLTLVTTNRHIMGDHVNSQIMTLTAWAITGVVMLFNFLLVFFML